MVLGNYTKFKAKHVDCIKFGDTAWSETDMASTTLALDTTFATNNASPLLDLAGAADTVNPTASYAFAKDFTEGGNEISTSEEGLLGADTQGSQNSEIVDSNNSKIEVEFTCVYRNPVPATIFNNTTKCCLISMDNSESASTGVLNIAYNNITMTHVGSLSRNNDGMMEQKVKFICRGGTSGSTISVTQAAPSESWSRIRLGLDKAEEIRTA